MAELVNNVAAIEKVWVPMQQCQRLFFVGNKPHNLALKQYRPSATPLYLSGSFPSLTATLN